MKWLGIAGVVINLVIANSCLASSTQPEEGIDYISLPNPQKISTEDGRAEVLEFILFHCPHCARLDPLVKKWAISRGDAVFFKTLHATFRGPNDPEVRLFHTLEAMNELSVWRLKVFHAIQRQGFLPNSDNNVLDWAKQSELDYNEFLRAWNSPEVINSTANAPATVKAYGLTYAPAFIVAGKFLTSPSLIQKNNPSLPRTMIDDALFNVLNYLVKRSSSAAK